jgi:hypothetical protein
MEATAFYIQAGGLAITVLAWLWLIVRAFRQRRLWGFSSLILPPVGLAFAARHPRKGIPPLALTLIGLVVTAIPALYIRIVPLDLGPRLKIVDGQRHLTLTGWDRKDYSVLKQEPEVVVLQMANPDVTDQTLEALKGMDKLKELDLNDTQVTDTGLALLKQLPALSVLRLARTRITDQGFRDNLSAMESLMKLDLSGDPQVSDETVRAWRQAKAGRQALK